MYHRQFNLTFRTESGATTPGKSEPGSNGNEGVLYIPQSAKIGASPSDCLGAYQEHSLKESHPSAKMLSTYSTDRAG